jgi:hypothetical protein
MGIFSPPQQSFPYVPPLPPAPPPPPTPVDPAAEKAAAQTKSRYAAAGGFGSTLLTGGQGVGGTANVQNKTLLGQ